MQASTGAVSDFVVDPASVPPKAGTQHALRDYQRQLAQRTLSAQQSPSAVQRQLGFVAAGQGWLIDMGDAAEIMPVPPLAKVPNTHLWFLGLINYRGALAGVVDFEAFLGRSPKAPRQTDRLIILSEKFPLRCALCVPEVSGLMDAGAVSQQKNTVSVPAHWAGPGWMHKDRQWHVLNLHLLLTDPRFSNAADH